MLIAVNLKGTLYMLYRMRSEVGRIEHKAEPSALLLETTPECGIAHYDMIILCYL